MMSSDMNRRLRRIFLPLLLILLVLMVWALFNGKDRTPGYKVALHIEPPQQPSLQVGFAKIDITPVVADRWTDANQDARFDKRDGDKWEDLNQNGHFDAVWMAGYQNKKPAQGVHDPLWVRCMVIDDGKTRVALASLDLIGLGHNEVVNIRERIRASAGITYAIITSTHVHEGPDTIGLWGENYFFSGTDPAYMEKVRSCTVQAIETAAARLRPAVLRFATDSLGAASMLADTRPPLVYDKNVHLIQALDAQADTTLGTILCWGNHPETLGSNNLLISSDFPHYWREYVEKGIYKGDSLIVKGLGGVAIFFTGAIGGLMTTHSDIAITDPVSGMTFAKESFEKIDAQGKQLAMLTIRALDSAAHLPDHIIRQGGITLRAKTLEIPLSNLYYKLAVALKVIDRGYSSWNRMRTEVAYLQIGDAIGMLCVPGEIYPEMVDGGIESPTGQDFAIAPVETPPLRSLMQGKQRIVLGLANDEIGYIIPKSQWDTKPPFTYNYQEAPYGEVNSTGPETAPLIYQALAEVIQK
ncbi:MAG: neutral/alkaline non-lysosomal ceramidase N-terminal domain-containing protein [Cytophagales bacterium]|nr:neutral/alkaline non-lysosomal ceramidase N-terminal domain-containing protein [Bernardetiaceae bacterium]MDW8205942.1 neutral/alkaline non-lysosomal ceramidase N-terminal domain-containing protein [Cytophagales bacterium]